LKTSVSLVFSFPSMSAAGFADTALAPTGRVFSGLLSPSDRRSESPGFCTAIELFGGFYAAF
jgi:hypothetical protein